MTSLQRNFFEMAATIAQQGVDSTKSQKAVLTEDFMLRSGLLERDYQDCLFAFVARGCRMPMRNINSLAMATALNKFSQGRILNESEALLALNSATFKRDLAEVVNKAMLLFDWPDQAVTREDRLYNPDEVMAIFLWIARHALLAFANPPKANMAAPLFHAQLTKMAHEKSRRPFIFAGTLGVDSVEILVDQASLFSANRLKRKSQQNNMGAEPGMRYYHAALSANALSPAKIDIVYWLKFDENHDVLKGEFINLGNGIATNYVNACLWSPYEMIQQGVNSSNVHNAPPAIVREIFSIYLDSLVN